VLLNTELDVTRHDFTIYKQLLAILFIKLLWQFKWPRVSSFTSVQITYINFVHSIVA